MTQKRVKASDVIGNSYYIYTLQSSNNTPSLNSTINITCNVTNVYGQAVNGKSITLYQNNTSQGAKTTDSNGNASWNSISMSSAGLQTFKVENSKIEVFVDNKSDVGHTHSQYLTEHQSLSNYVTTDDSRLSDSRTPTSHTHGNLQNNGQVGSTAQANKNVVTNSSGLITTEDKPTIPSASTSTPSADTTSGSYGSGTTYARANHIHPKSSIYAEATHTHSQYLTEHQSLSNYVTTDDSRLSDSRTPTSHTHGNLQNNGQVGSTAQASKNVVTDSSGKITTEDKPTIPTATSDLTNDGSDGSNAFVSTDDSRLSDARTPTSHNHGQISNDGKITREAVTAAVADKIIITDADDDSRIKRTNKLLADHIQDTTAHSNINSSANATQATINTNIDTALGNKANATHNHTKSQITDFPTIPSKTSDLTNDSGFLTSHQSLSGYLQTSDIKDNLTSTDTNKPLSANQGKELKTLIDNKEDKIYRIVGTEVSSPSSSYARLHCGTLPFDNMNGKIFVYVVPDISTLSASQKALIYGSYPSGVNISWNIFKSNNEYLTIGDIQTGDELLLMDEGDVRVISNSSISNKEDKSNKVTSISSSSTDTQYPSAKLLYNKLETKTDKANGTSQIGDLNYINYSNIKNDFEIVVQTDDVGTPQQTINARIDSRLGEKENTSNKVTSISSSSTDTQYPSAKLVYDQLNNKAPTSHASSSTTYGVATNSNYGHTKVINNLTTSSNNNGEALSAYQGKVLNDDKVDKNDFNVDYMHSFVYNSSTEKYGYQGQSGALGIGVSAIDINDNSLLNEDGVAIIDLVFQNTNISYGSIQLVLAEADGGRYTDSNDLSNTQTIATITDTNKHHITIVVSPDTHIEEQNYDYYDLKVSKISYDGSNITISGGKTSMERVGVYLVFDGAIGGNIEYMNVIKRTPIVNQIIDMIYPIGSTYISVNSVNPSFLFGGQWEQIQDKFLLASGSTYNAGSTGGSADAVVVSHNHTQSSHSHEPSNTDYSFLASQGNIAVNGTKRAFPSTSSSGHYFVYQDGSSGSAQGINEYTNTSSVTPTINSNGVSGTGKNMPPYLTVYMWKRIA